MNSRVIMTVLFSRAAQVRCANMESLEPKLTHVHGFARVSLTRPYSNSASIVTTK